jgi:cold shock CspA family protein
MEANEVHNGKIISWFINSGYGFVQESNTGDSYFLHIKDTLTRDVEKGMEIRFIIGDYNGRVIAKQVD